MNGVNKFRITVVEFVVVASESFIYTSKLRIGGLKELGGTPFCQDTLAFLDPWTLADTLTGKLGRTIQKDNKIYQYTEIVYMHLFVINTKTTKL